jgi:hypothetical protein
MLKRASSISPGVGVLDDGGLGQGTPPMFAITIAIAAPGRIADPECWPRKHDAADNSGVLGQRYGKDRQAHETGARHS